MAGEYKEQEEKMQRTLDNLSENYATLRAGRANASVLNKITRLLFPPLTEERRRDLTKQVKKYAEEAKVVVRNIRRDAMDVFKAQKKKSEITEDDYDDIEKDIQNLTDKYIKQVDKIAADKEAELLEV